MTETGGLELVRRLFLQLQRRRFPIGPSDLADLRRALAAGFGWSSHEALCELVVALWAKSPREAATLRALFAQLEWPEDWTPEADVAAPPKESTQTDALAAVTGDGTAAPDGGPAAAPAADTTAVRSVGSLPPLTLQGVKISDARLVLTEQYPLTHREIAQAFRRLRRPTRFGPATELDVDATIRQRLETGVATPPRLVPRRRNASRLALFVDVEGSMQAYAPFVEAFCDAVREAGQLQNTSLHFFHDVPGEGADRALLAELPAKDFLPVFDSLLARIEPCGDGEVYADRELFMGVPLRSVLASLAPGTAALVVSDAGAARGHVDLGRMLDALAFVKALRHGFSSVAWLNPVPRPLWQNTLAAQLARHVPMYPLDLSGLQPVVNALRGQPVALERAL